MNGEFQELLDALKDWGKERHEENLKKFEKIFDKLDNLPCDERKGLYGSIKTQLGLHWILITIILVAILRLAL